MVEFLFLTHLATDAMLVPGVRTCCCRSGLGVLSLPAPVGNINFQILLAPKRTIWKKSERS